MAVMTAAQFVQKLKNIVNRPNRYRNVFPYNLGYFDGSRISFDCWNLVKALINEPSIDQNYIVGHHAPAVNNMADIDGWTMLQNCSGRSQNFKNLTAGEFLYMSGHAGVYIGNGQVVECTGDWEGGVLISRITENGGRYRGSAWGRSWEWHGKLKWIDYSGSGSDDVTPKGSYKWLPPVTGYNADDYNNGYAGDGYPGRQGAATPICLVAIDDPQVVYRAKQRDNQQWLPWVYGKDYNPKDLVKGCAGNPGKVIDEIEFYMLDGSEMLGDAADIVQGRWLPPVICRKKVVDTIGNPGHACGAVAFKSKTLRKYCVATI